MMLADESTSSEGDQFYEDPQQLPEQPPEKDLYLIGDWDAKVESREIPRITGKSGLGVQNESRAKANRVLSKAHLVIGNTIFQQRKR